MDPKDLALSPDRIEAVLDRLVPLISEPGEEGMNRFLLRRVAENSPSVVFSEIARKILSGEFR